MHIKSRMEWNGVRTRWISGLHGCPTPAGGSSMQLSCVSLVAKYFLTGRVSVRLDADPPYQRL